MAQYKEVDDITRSDLVLLVSTSIDNNKYFAKLSDIETNILSKIEDVSEVSTEGGNLISDLIDGGTINLGAVFNILANKTVEKVIDTPGSIYFDGIGVRVRTKDEWKTLMFKDER